MYGRPSFFLLASSLVLASSAVAHANPVTVLATDSVYAAGGYAPNPPSYGATAPSAIHLASGATSVTFQVANINSGPATITVNGGGNYNDADGIGSASGEYNTGVGSLSGITAPTAGFIAGVFLGPNGPSGTAPAALNFDGTGATSFSSLSPLLNQVFYIGDGLTGDNTGAQQTFYIPTGSTALYLGLTDACGYSGGPSCYGDNQGQFMVNVNVAGGGGSTTPVAATPEPSSLWLLGTGILGTAGTLRRRFRLR